MLETLDHRSGLSYEDRLKKVIRFVSAIVNWCVCDMFCGDALWCRKHKDETWQLRGSWLRHYTSSGEAQTDQSIISHKKKSARYHIERHSFSNLKLNL